MRRWYCLISLLTLLDPSYSGAIEVKEVSNFTEMAKKFPDLKWKATNPSAEWDTEHDVSVLSTVHVSFNVQGCAKLSPSDLNFGYDFNWPEFPVGSKLYVYGYPIIKDKDTWKTSNFPLDASEQQYHYEKDIWKDGDRKVSSSVPS